VRENHPALNIILPESTQKWLGSKFLPACANSATTYNPPCLNKGRVMVPNGSTSRASSAARQTSVIQQLNHNGKRQAMGNNIELPVKARNKSATWTTYD
jgi:hypothetical protein